MSYDLKAVDWGLVTGFWITGSQDHRMLEFRLET